ncbi:hypothetical protein PISMIDRAFT_16900 [Pisolithus microcarpus 441]|uniref:Unplaced genomic scaffold scaffold_230, whole genome shotgun sequence n=1 Tax=Pisolithus microcarpus 441 TaxID=765257 RepID=A0A0C9YXP6_9AGAM|nr:hypothetical protein PISMIDRAFT_16900 [Pisolithus microcarpus 441]
MLTSNATTSSQPVYIPPDAIHQQIPKRWAKLMGAFAAVMRVILDEVAEEDVVQEWMDSFEEVSAQIEEWWQFAANMSTEVPRYPEDTEEAILSGFLMLVALHNWFPRDSRKSRPKLAPGAATTPKIEKAAVTDNGPKDTTHTTNSVPVEVMAAAPHKVPAATQEPVIVVNNQTKVMQELRGGVKSTAQALQGTNEPSLASAAAPLNLKLPLTTPSISQPPPPLFLPSSPMNMPIPSTSQTKVEPQDDPTTFAASLGSLLDEAPGSEFEADRSGDEGDLETPQVSVEGEDDISNHPQGSAEARWTLFSGTPHAVAQYDAHLAAAIGIVEWAESIMAELHSGMGQLGLVIQQAKREICQLQEWQ